MSDLKLNFQIERYFGSQNTVNLIYTLVSNTSCIDLYFSSNKMKPTYLVDFESMQFQKQIFLILNSVYSYTPKSFYIYLTNTIQFDLKHTVKSYDTNKISKYFNKVKILILPSVDSSFRNIISFTSRYIMIPFFEDKNLLL